MDRNVRLLDCPGVVFNDNSTLLGCVDGESIDDPVPPIEAILRRCDHKSLQMTYNIPAFPAGDTMVFLAMVAKAHGRVLKGGIPNKISAARTVLRDWNSGKIQFYMPPPKDTVMTTVETKNSAVIVSEMSKEFNLEQWDQEVMSSLKDKDEFDFVKLKADPYREASMDVDALAFLKGEGGDSDEDDDDMEVDDGKVSRANLKDAEDYDFDGM